MEGNLKFIMKTEGVKNDKLENKVVESSKLEEEKEGFRDWIRGLFSKNEK